MFPHPIYEAMSKPLCLLLTTNNYQDATFLGSALNVPTSTYLDIANPIDTLVDHENLIIDDESADIQALFASHRNSLLYTAAVITAQTASNRHQRALLARAMVAAARALGQKGTLVLDGTDILLMAEACKVCIANGISYASPQDFEEGLKLQLTTFRYASEAHTQRYKICNFDIPADTVQQNIGACLTEGQTTKQIATTTAPLFTSFGSYTASPATPVNRAITHVQQATPTTPAPAQFSFI